MAHVIIIGGGIAGLAAALYLDKIYPQQSGHSITVLEKDRASLPESADKAFNWDRKGAPQVRHSHGMLARLRNLLHNDHPEVLRRLLAAGATEMKLYEDMPVVDGGVGIDGDVDAALDSASDRTWDSLDKEVVMLACRRTTLEWVLRASVLDSGTVQFRSGATVSRLLSSEDQSPVPVINGVELADGTRLAADLVIAADGRGSGVPKWLKAVGVDLEPDLSEPAGIMYCSRFYQLADGQPFPTSSLVAADVGHLSYAAFCGDNGVFSITLSISENDTLLREAVKNPQVFDRIVAVTPELARWTVDAEPITDVFCMAGFQNRRRHFLKEGAAIVTGLHAIGDAHICTNPAYGRGLSTGFWQAKLLADAMTAYPDNLPEQSRHFCTAVQEHIVPWFDMAAMMDRDKRLALESSEKTPDNTAHTGSVADENPMKALSEAAAADPLVWRAFWRTMNLLEPPTTLMQPEFIDQLVQVSQRLASGTPVKDGAADQQQGLVALDRETMLKVLGVSVTG